MRAKIFILTALVFFIANLSAMAQVVNPCGGNGDPDNPTDCPLDTWVWILVIAVTAFAIWQWQQQQRHLVKA
jgi:hypothetical protein